MRHFVKLIAALCFLIAPSAIGQGSDFHKLNWPKPANLSEIYVVFGPDNFPKTREGDTTAIYTLDENQNLIQTKSMSRGEVRSMEDFKYNDQNQLIYRKDYGRWYYSQNDQGEETKIWDSSIVISVQKYYYKDRKLIREEYYQWDEAFLESKTEYRYNKNGDLIEELTIEYPGSNTINFKTKSTEIDYDAKPPSNAILLLSKYETDGNVTRVSRYKNDSLVGNVKIVKNKAGNVFEHFRLGRKNEIGSKSNYIYNDNNLLVEVNSDSLGVDGFRQVYNPKLDPKAVYGYDENGFLTSISYYKGGKLSSSRRYLYKQRDVD